MDERKWLDCTMRDGGYILGWDYSDEFVHDYLRCCEAIGVDYVELGLMNDTGVQRWSSIGLKDLQIETTCKKAVMADYGKCSLSRLRVLRDTDVELVRITTTMEDITDSAALAKEVKQETGKSVSLNLMRISLLEVSDLIKASRIVDLYGIDLLYLADSYGSCTPDQITSIQSLIEILKRDHCMGFHAHNNLGLAFFLTSSLSTEYYDTTITGVGRGAGNTQTELVCGQESLVHIWEFYAKHLKDRPEQWGYNFANVITAAYNLHPTTKNPERKFYEKHSDHTDQK